MAKRLILLFLIFLFIFACTFKPKSYESATKWYVCNPLYPIFHPGDWIAVEDDFKKECNEECNKKIICARAVDLDLPSMESEKDAEEYGSCLRNSILCKISCVEKSYPIAKHVGGGYYSDGSYYAGCQPLYFSNIHPTADKYNKTKWQTDRDDCMKLTAENVKVKFLTPSWLITKRTKNYYKSCLKERGHLN